MIGAQFILPIAGELVVDLFAGGGGASTGIEQAIGRHVDIAVNHDQQAVSLHQANHPQTRHFVSDVFEVDPLVVTEGQPVGLLWASPDCKHFSKAKGGKPRSKKVRALANVIVEWAEAVRPRIICMENVEEFVTWGELDVNGKPVPELAGLLFQEWKRKFEALGYVGEFRVLRACNYGAPTIRKRLFGVFRCDGLPIVWPAETHAAAPAKGSGLLPYRTAADCIDWSIPCPSIFERTKPLAEATQRRIAHGIKRYVIEAAKPYIVRIGQTGHGDGGKVRSIGEPLSTVTTKAEHLLASPTLIQTGYGERPGQAPRVPGLHKPLGTAVDGQKHAVVAAYLAKHFGGEPQDGKTCTSVERPAPTVTARDHSSIVTASLSTYYGAKSPTDGRGATVNEPLRTQTTENRHALVTSNLVKLRGTSSSAASGEPLHTVSAQGQHHALVASHLIGAGGPEYGGKPRPVDEPMGTVTTENHRAEVRALLMKYYGTDQAPELLDPMHTVTTKDRFGLVTVDCVDYYIADIGMRMLQPRELYRAQGFPETYIIDRGHDGRVLPKDAQVRMCGNSVCPPLARAIVAANYTERQALKEAA